MLRAGTASVAALAPVMTDMQRQLDDMTGRLASANATAERAASRDALLSEWASLTMDGRRTILRDLVADGWHFQLRPFVDGEPDERIVVFNEADALDGPGVDTLGWR